jgi:hypothetical protein
MPDAVCLYADKRTYEDGTIVQLVIWLVPDALPGSHHRFKYSLYYGRDGVRIVGYDNERGKGDHRHVRGVELAYRFSTPDQLIADFMADVRANGGDRL